MSTYLSHFTECSLRSKHCRWSLFSSVRNQFCSIYREDQMNVQNLWLVGQFAPWPSEPTCWWSSLLQADLLPSASPWARTHSTLGLWWAVSRHKTKQYNQLGAEDVWQAAPLGFRFEVPFHSLGYWFYLPTSNNGLKHNVLRWQCSLVSAAGQAESNPRLL